MRLLLVATLLTAAGSQQPTPPAAPQTFRSGAQIVEVDVRVLGKDGKFVTDLGLADFEISEDGVPQKIQSVVLIGRDPAPAAPLAPSAPAPVAPFAPLAPLAPGAQPQTWVFVFDTTHLGAGPLQRARSAVVEFIRNRFRTGDLGGIVADGKLGNNRFTSDRAELLKAAENVKMPGDARARVLLQKEWPRFQDEDEAWRFTQGDREAIRVAMTRACQEDPDACKGRGGPEIVESLLGDKARQAITNSRTWALATLKVANALANGLARMAGPKTIVFFSEGFSIRDLETDFRLAVGQAARAGAQFYTIDARGLDKTGGSIIDQPVAAAIVGAQQKFDTQADGTNSLAVDTGGFAIRNENNFGRALDEIQRDAGTYYVVGYTPAKETFDGKYREISVKVSRPGVKVRSRRGYLALEPATLLRPKSPPAGASPSTAAPAVPPKLRSEEPGAKADRITSELPVVPISLGLLALPETLAAPATMPVSVAGARIEPAKVVAALGRESASARLRPGGYGETSSPLNSPGELGWAAYEKGDVETAARHLGEAAKAADARPWVVYALGLSHFALRHHADAAQAWERVRGAAPEFEPIYFALADAYGLQREDGTALKVLREAERRWPADPEVSNAIGVIQIRRGALDAAIESFERATTVAPADALGHFNLARAHQMRLLKSQRYDSLMQKWIGGDEDRRRAIANFQKYLQLGGPYERQAREALSALGWS
jgi:VWFA-related protein